jgi:DNA repair protein RadC
MTLFVPEIKIAVSWDKELPTSELIKIGSSKDAANAFRTIFNKDTFCWQEEALILCVNNSNKIMGFFKLSSGGMTGTLIDVRMVFTVALKTLATGIILAHNHPSGSLIASESDKQITRKLKQAGEFLDIKVLDHIILTDIDYLSFADEGIL